MLTETQIQERNPTFVARLLRFQVYDLHQARLLGDQEDHYQEAPKDQEHEERGKEIPLICVYFVIQ